LRAIGVLAAPGPRRLPSLLVLLLTFGPLACSTRSLSDLSRAWSSDASAAQPGAGNGTGGADGGGDDVEPADPRVPDAAPDLEPAGDGHAPDDPPAPSGIEGAAEAGAVAVADASGPLPHVALLASRIDIGTADAAIAKRLGALGLTVDIHADSEIGALDLGGVALVFVSATVDATTVGSALRGLDRPIIVCEPFLFDNFAMTPSGASVGELWGISSQQTSLEILAPQMALAAGLHGQVVVAGVPVRLNWATPPSNALSIASLVNQPDRLAVFAFETGSKMVGLTAPARRVGFFLDLRTANDLAPGGWALFDAAVTWALGR
jgi:hypothetical protein